MSNIAMAAEELATKLVRTEDPSEYSRLEAKIKLLKELHSIVTPLSIMGTPEECANIVLRHVIDMSADRVKDSSGYSGRIPTIKWVRCQFGVGLKEAKEFVESIAGSLTSKQNNPPY